MVYDILVYTDTGIHENHSLLQRINSFKPELLLYNTYHLGLNISLVFRAELS